MLQEYDIHDTKGKMFDCEETDVRLGDLLHVSDRLYKLKQVEEYLLENSKKYEFDLCYDLTSAQPPFFDHLNYTNFSDFFMMRPLNPDLAHKQVQDALIFHEESEDDFDYYTFIKQKVLKNQSNKYIDLSEKVTFDNDEYDAVVCLIGGNKLFDNVCFNKLNLIVRNHGKRVIFKPHPLTTDQEVERIKANLPRHVKFAEPYENVYTYIKYSTTVYTTHWSETAVYASCLVKNVDPIDTFQSKFFSSYGHINTHIFNQSNKKKIINRVFNDFRSGLVNPVTQYNWKDRIDHYLEYIDYERYRVKDFYV